jgi:RNA polymerase sigma-70 factor (ECF subfamily)
MTTPHPQDARSDTSPLRASLEPAADGEPAASEGRDATSSGTAAPDADDVALVARVRAGDVAAFETIYRSYVASLDGYAMHYVGSREAAQDIVQETFLRLWQRREQWEPRSGIGNYLFGAVRNRAIMALRRESVARRCERVHAAAGTSPAMGTPPAHALDQVARGELALAFTLAFTRLPKQARAVAQMRWYQHLSYHEIAAALGLSVKTVDNYLARSVRLMRAALTPFQP